MKKKWTKCRLALSIVFALVPSVLLSQVQSSLSPDDYSGVGIDVNLEKARLSALNALTQQIQVFVSSSFENRTTEINRGLDQRTYSNVVARSVIDLRDVKERSERLEDGSFRVTKYVSKDAVKEMFGRRRERILEHLRIAQQELLGSRLNLGSSLKHFYWAYLLARLYPDTLSFSISIDSAKRGRSTNLAVEVPNVLESLIKQLEFRPIKRIEDEIIVWKYGATLNRRPIASLQFNYFDGMGQTEGEVKDGEVKIALFFSKKENREREIVIDVEFKYAGEMDEILHLADTLRTSTTIPNTFTVLIPGGSEIPAVSKPVSLPPERKPPISLPKPLSDLISTGNDFSMTIKKVNTLVKQNKILAGSAKDFESLEGMYGLILGPEGIAAVVKCDKGKYYDASTGKLIDLKGFAGKKITWIEVFK